MAHLDGEFQLAQLNVARMLGPLDSALMADFKAGLAPMNALADDAPGFVWRLSTPEGDPAVARAFPDPQMIVNLSVWRDIDALRAYAYRGEHAEYVRRRREWFSKMAEAFLVLWWVPAGHRPTPAEAAERLDRVHRDGPTAYAFNFQRLFPSPEPAFAAAPVVAPLAASDRAAWDVLARGYKLFYNTPTTDEEYERAWTRLMQRDGIIGLGATVNGKLVGIAHYLFHTNVWASTACYLQDLYTDPALRGRGIARALIEAVANDARAQGAARYYWLTQSSNATARTLYDKVAAFKGFIRYDYPLG